jgi:hypothetical protein
VISKNWVQERIDANSLRVYDESRGTARCVAQTWPGRRTDVRNGCETLCFATAMAAFRSNRSFGDRFLLSLEQGRSGPIQGMMGVTQMLFHDFRRLRWVWVCVLVLVLVIIDGFSFDSMW